MDGRAPHILPPVVIYSLFAVGIVSAIAFRSVIIFQRIEPSWVRPVWYTAVTGYIVFFLYRYAIAKKRKAAIERFGLIDKVKAEACLSDEDREVVIYLLSSIKKSPEELNYLVIFILSVIAVIADVVLSLITSP